MARPALLLLALALAAPPALAKPTDAASPAAAERVLSGTRFKCDVGGDLTARFAARGEAFGALVDAGDGPHFLPVQPMVPGPVKLTWSDGRRTLTWSPGVQIQWTDGPAQRWCGRGAEGHRH